MIYSYEGLHYDVLNLGKQEVWMGKETLLGIMDTAKCDFISANLLDVKSKKPFLKPYVIKDYGNLRVGVLGVLNEMDFPKGTSMLDTTVFAVSPSADALRKYVPMLNKKCDAVVVLCELSSAALDTLCLQIPGIDLVISSGALKSGEAMTTVGSTQIVGTGSSGYSGHYAMIEVAPELETPKVTNFNEFLTDIYEEHGEWADKLAAFNQNPPPAYVPKSATGTPPATVSPVKPVPTTNAESTTKTTG